MNERLIAASIELLKRSGIEFDKGLTEPEINSIENLFDIKFPPDLKLFLQIGIPISNDFPNWRLAIADSRERERLMRIFDWPLNGLLFDITNNDFWIDAWDKEPTSLDEKYLIVKGKFLNYPKLIPIYSHRYIPSKPLETGNPIISVYQTDIIYYGNDLLSYFENEFKIKLPDSYYPPNQPKKIEFWSPLIEN